MLLFFSQQSLNLPCSEPGWAAEVHADGHARGTDPSRVVHTQTSEQPVLAALAASWNRSTLSTCALHFLSWAVYKHGESGTCLPLSPWICTFPTKGSRFATSSCRTGPIPPCHLLLFPQKPLREWPCADPQRRFPGLAWPAVSPGAVSGTRAKVRARPVSAGSLQGQWQEQIYPLASPDLACGCQPGSTRSVQLQRPFPLPCLSPARLPTNWPGHAHVPSTPSSHPCHQP